MLFHGLLQLQRWRVREIFSRWEVMRTGSSDPEALLIKRRLPYVWDNSFITCVPLTGGSITRVDEVLLSQHCQCLKKEVFDNLLALHVRGLQCTPPCQSLPRCHAHALVLSRIILWIKFHAASMAEGLNSHVPVKGTKHIHTQKIPLYRMTEIDNLAAWLIWCGIHMYTFVCSLYTFI